MKTRVPTSVHIPKGARSVIGEAFVVLMRTFLQTQSEESWTKILMLPKCILGPCRGGKAHKRAFLKTILDRTERWQMGDQLGLWTECIPSQHPLKDALQQDHDKLSQTTVKSILTAAHEGNISKVARLLQDSKLAPWTPQTVEALKALNPEGQPVHQQQPW